MFWQEISDLIEINPSIGGDHIVRTDYMNGLILLCAFLTPLDRHQTDRSQLAVVIIVRAWVVVFWSSKKNGRTRNQLLVSGKADSLLAEIEQICINIPWRADGGMQGDRSADSMTTGIAFFMMVGHWFLLCGNNRNRYHPNLRPGHLCFGWVRLAALLPTL